MTNRIMKFYNWLQSVVWHGNSRNDNWNFTWCTCGLQLINQHFSWPKVGRDSIYTLKPKMLGQKQSFADLKDFLKRNSNSSCYLKNKSKSYAWKLEPPKLIINMLIFMLKIFFSKTLVCKDLSLLQIQFSRFSLGFIYFVCFYG